MDARYDGYNAVREHATARTVRAMSSIDHDNLTLAALERALAEADETAILTPPRILRRVIKQHTHATGFGSRVPHRKVYMMHREALLAIVDRAELDLPPERELADRLILISRPSAERLANISAVEALTLVWRLLFHGRVHVALEALAGAGRLRPADVRQRIGQIGKVEFDEIRSVLASEDLLLPPQSDLSIYIEFVAVYLELRHFASGFLPAYFPSIDSFDRIDEVVDRDVDVEELLSVTRLPGAAEEPDRSDSVINDSPEPIEYHDRRRPRKFSQRVAQRLAAAADRVGPLGNSVRSAMLRFQASRGIGGELGRDARFAALSDVARLARRLQQAIGFSDTDARAWEESLAVLVDVSSAHVWSPGVRLMYDLQKVCLDHERGVYAIDVVGWLKRNGRGPLKQPLPGQRFVLISKHLRSASRRLASVPLGGRARLRLGSLLNSAMDRAENNLRAHFKPLIDEAFNAVDLRPHNLPERVAQHKLIDELLDRIVERGFLTMGDLRDAISRNNLKLPDVSKRRELVMGDQVLQADRQLAPRLDGVYHRGEIYLRWPQQLSSLAFGTPPGRFLTQFVAIPFGGAFLILSGVQHLVDALYGHESHQAAQQVEDASLVELPTVTPASAIHINTLPAVILLGVFLLGLLQHAAFRRICGQVAMTIGRGLRTDFFEMPAWLYRQPWIRAIVRSWPFQAAVQYLIKPLIVSALVWVALALVVSWRTTTESALGVFVVINVLLNSRLGRTVDEMVTDWIVGTWHRFRIHVVAALFRWVMDLFHGILEGIERVLYAVDEWLRFRTGEGRVVTGIKAVLGVIWGVINYIIRFFVNLLIEPQINPIKHFPVVTVSHKLILPTLPLLRGVLLPVLGEFATPLATAIVFLTPGIFGFLVWELKENWRLYAANRPLQLQPIAVGHHGETMLQFMRPGFRSGTLPKLYARLRRANRRAYWTRNWRAAGKLLRGLHDVEESVRRFTNRELCALLEGAAGWHGAQIATGEIHLATNRVTIELYSPDLGEDSLWLALDEQSGWLVAGVRHRGWLDQLSNERRVTFENALAGFYKMAGVDLVREEIESQLAPDEADYDIAADKLVALQGSDAHPRGLGHLDEVLFSNRSITWNEWIAIWQSDQEQRHNSAAESVAQAPKV
jgi:hypothetical protein